MPDQLRAKHLCKKCIHRGEVNEEGKVYCKPVKRHVEPVLRRDYKRYEDCPYRAEARVDKVPMAVLKQLAEKARELGISSVDELAPIERKLCEEYHSKHP